MNMEVQMPASMISMIRESLEMSLLSAHLARRDGRQSDVGRYVKRVRQCRNALRGA